MLILLEEGKFKKDLKKKNFFKFSYKGGDGAQEENLHRRSNLYQSLEDPGTI